MSVAALSRTTSPLRPAPLFAQQLFASPTASSPPFPTYDGKKYVPNQIVVRFIPGVTPGEVEVTNYMYGAEKVRIWNKVLGFYLLEVTDPDAEFEEVLEKYERDPLVEWAHSNWRGELAFTPNDTSFGTQWHLNNIANPEISIQAVSAWDVTRGNPAAVIALVDTGLGNGLVQQAHQEFQNRVLQGYDFVETDEFPDDDDETDHGTKVAGVVAANTNNQFSVAGVDHQAMILPVKWFSPSGGGSVQMAMAIQWAADRAHVINVSAQVPTPAPEIPLAVDYARSRGRIVIAAAGNYSGTGPPACAPFALPGSLPNVISVSATTNTDTRVSSSCYGSTVDVSAPGGAIVTVYPLDPLLNATTTVTGTSFAAPLVAGAASLRLALDPDLSHDEFAKILEITVKDLGGPGWDIEFGWGRLDLDRVVNYIFSDGFETGDTSAWSDTVP